MSAATTIHSISRTLLPAWGALLCFVSASAFAKDFVVDPGDCGKQGGSGNFCTIQEALDAAFLDGGGDVVVMPGTYHENLVLREEVNVVGEGTVVIEYVNDGAPSPVLVKAANNSGLEHLTLRVPAGIDIPVVLVHIQQVEEVELEDVVLDGGMNRNTTGIFVQTQLLDTSRVRNTDITRVEVGVLAEDARFRITRCLFEDILRDAIFVRLPTVKAGETEVEVENELPEVGDENDLELSGFNRFRNIGGFTDGGGAPLNEGDAFYLRNTTGVQLTAQLNDWGLYESDGIAGLLSTSPPGAKRAAKAAADAAVFEPFLGKSLFPGSVFARLRDSVTTTPILNGNPRLLLGGSDTGIEPAFDAVSKLYSFTFINPNTYGVRGQAPGYLDASKLGLIVGPGQIVATEILMTPDGTAEGEGQPVDTGYSTDQNGDSKVDLTELLRVIQLFNAVDYHCGVGTEDGFAVGAGDETCPKHAADYMPPDWQFTLSETLRVVQFFNTGGYHACAGAGSEDGYCPGPPV